MMSKESELQLEVDSLRRKQRIYTMQAHTKVGRIVDLEDKLKTMEYSAEHHASQISVLEAEKATLKAQLEREKLAHARVRAVLLSVEDWLQLRMEAIPRFMLDEANVLLCKILGCT